MEVVGVFQSYLLNCNFSVIAMFHYQLNLGKAKRTTAENRIIVFKLFKLTENRLKF